MTAYVENSKESTKQLSELTAKLRKIAGYNVNI